MAVASTVDPQTSFLTSTPREFFDGLRLQFDLVWIATVLGGIADSEINKLADDITLALRPGGLCSLPKILLLKIPTIPFGDPGQKHGTKNFLIQEV